MLQWDDLQRLGGEIFAGYKSGDGFGLQNLQDLQLGDLLQQNGLNIADLSNLSTDQLSELLGQAGIDVTALTDGQLGEIIQGLTSESTLAGFDIQRFFER
ncbi:MAG: hypothetical protein HC850_06660 [Rhodomicrobium sp.]|nr:hypothetical protein [Rhodomicrobium sp.]